MTKPYLQGRLLRVGDRLRYHIVGGHLEVPGPPAQRNRARR